MSKPLCCMEAALLYGARIELPDSEVEKWFDYYESNGWRVGRSPMKSWEAAMRNWKRNWKEGQQRRNGNGAHNSVPVWEQIRLLEEAIKQHPANPTWVGYDNRKVTEALRADLKEKRAKLEKLQQARLAAI